MIINDVSICDAIKTPDNPFPGLRPFEFHESHLFFGRDGQVEKLIDKLSAKRFLAVVGTSGSGKSSLVRAGLLPALMGGLMSAAGCRWRFLVMRPGNDPIANLARALNEPETFGSDDLQNRAIQTAVAETTLRRGTRGLVESVLQNAMPQNENLLIVVDQFEELFRFAREARRRTREESERYQNDAAAFVKLLLEACSQSEANIFVVLTMRSDFLGDCARFWDLPEAINESQYLIPRLTRDQLREVIAGPVTLAGGEITQPLVTRLLNDVVQNQDQLPLLQHLLMRMWTESKERRLHDGKPAKSKSAAANSHRGKALNICCYEAVGGLSRALSRHADEAYAELSAERQQLAERIFKCLTEKGPDNREIRRPLAVRDLCKVTGANREEIIEIIEVFRKPGRSFLIPAADVDLDDDSLIDISHESLIRNWTGASDKEEDWRLLEWVEDEARSARIYRRLAETAALYKIRQAALWGDPDLQIALDWRERIRPNADWAQRYNPRFDQAMDFLDQSRDARDAEAIKRQQQRRQEVRRARTTSLVFAVLFLAALGGFAYAFAQAARTRVAYAELSRQSEEITKQRNSAEAARVDAYNKEQQAKKSARDTELARSELQEQAQNLQASLDREEAAKRAALEARGRAVRAQGEKEEQAKLSGFFRDAFGDLALNNAEGRESAIAHLNSALAYYKGKNDLTNVVSTHLNIADTYRAAYLNDPDENEDEGPKATKSYDTAIAILRGEAQDQKNTAKQQLDAREKLGSVLDRAGSVWAESDEPDLRDEAANYYSDAAGVWGALGHREEQTTSWIQVGVILCKSDTTEDLGRAKEAFDHAVEVYDDRSKRADIMENIGIACEGLLNTEQNPFAMQSRLTAVATPTPSSFESKSSNTRTEWLRDTAVNYFTDAAQLYSSTDHNKAAEKYGKAASLLRRFSNNRRDKSRAAELYVRASQEFAAIGDKQRQSGELINAGSVFREASESELWAKAGEFYDKAIAVFHDSDSKQLEAKALQSIGESYDESEDPAQRKKATEYYERAVDVYHAAGLKPEEAKILESVGESLTESDDPERQRKGVEYYERAISLYHDTGQKGAEGAALASVARFFAESGDTEDLHKAVTYHDRAATAYGEANNQSGQVDQLIAAGSGLKNLTDEQSRRDAAAYYERAIAVYSDSSKQVSTLIRIGRIFIQPASAAPPVEADRYFQRALTLAQDKGGKKSAAAAYSDIGAAYQTGKKTPLAIAYFEKSAALYKEADDKLGEATALYRLALINKAQAPELAKQALTLYSELLPALDSLPDKKAVADAYYAMGSLYRIKEANEDALASYTKALVIYQKIPTQRARASLTRRNIDQLRKEMAAKQ